MPASNNQMEEGDATIVRRIRDGEVEAFRILVERHSRALYALAHRMTGNAHDAEDIVQETLMRAYKQLDRFESRAEFGTWIHRIGVNCALDHLRSRKSREQVIQDAQGAGDGHEEIVASLPTKQPSALQQLADSQIRHHVEGALGALSVTERSAFVMRHFQEMPLNEIGHALGINENAVKNTIFRAVQKVRRALEPIVGDLR
jgi:RNA polymerase sigma-70 factor (ECF subfamily)